MNRKFSLALVALCLSLSSLAGVKVTSLNLKTEGSNGYISVVLDGKSRELPEIKVSGKVIELSLSNSDAFNSIFKNIQGAQLSANSLNGKAVIKAVLPYNVSADSVNVSLKKSNIEVIFPRGKVVKEEKKVAYEGPGVAPKEVKPEVKAPVIEKKMENKISKDLLNEDYLNKLMKEENTAKKEAKAEVKKDEIKVKQAAPVKAQEATNPQAKPSSNDSFSFAGYAAKFTIFLAVVLGMFYGVVQLLKKGVFNRGKLGFLNNSQMIEVLSTTYVGPKRSLMVVKAHKQIFLVANSESGLTYLSEMTDTTGLIKEGEKHVTGTNFDVNLGSAENSTDLETKIKMKENIMESTPVAEEKGLNKIAVAKDIVKFSDELKKKAKKLKPIEFN